MVKRYRIKDYTDGLIDASSCDECPPSTAALWDGSFVAPAYESSGPCCWQPDLSAGSRIDGKGIGWGAGGSPCVRGGIHILNKGGGVCVWELVVPCPDEHSGWYSIWTGEKPTGLLAGTFSKTGGCATGPSTLETEEAP